MRRIEEGFDADELREATLEAVAAKVDRFFEVVRSSDTDEPQAAFDVIAAWADLWRTRPALIAEVVGSSVSEGRDLLKDGWADVLGMEAFVEAEERLQRRLPELVRLALQVPKPVQWVDELEEFVDVTVEGEGATDQWAKDLLTDLDAAELVVSAARIAGVEVPERVELGMRLARGALEHEAEVFTGVRRWFTARARAVELERPAHRELVASASWYLPLLREVLSFEAWRRGEEPVDPVAQTTAAELLHARQGQEPPTASVARDVLPEPIREHRGAYLAAAPEAPPRAWRKPARWLSADGRYVAVARLPVESSEAEAFPMRIHHAAKVGDEFFEGAPADDLAGGRVRIADVEAPIIEGGHVQFSAEELQCAIEQASDRDLIVSIGAEEQRFKRVED
ncbi:MAG: hypothetical protein D6725_10925 [Planctomycetota bacterium]|nr:MAG: hypothetical protein D6725_10925 [Planctomycetota bacterium]